MSTCSLDEFLPAFHEFDLKSFVPVPVFDRSLWALYIRMGDLLLLVGVPTSASFPPLGCL